MGPTNPFGMLAASRLARSALRAQTRLWGEQWRWRLAAGGGWPELQPGETARAQQKADVSSSHWKPPQHTGSRADSDLPQNQPNGMSLTGWPGHSVTLRPPRRILWPMSSSAECQKWGDGSWSQLCPCCLTALWPLSAHALRGREAAGRRGLHWGLEGKGRGQKGRWGPGRPELGLGRRRVSRQL